MTSEVAAEIAGRFAIEGLVDDAREYPGGLIHDSFVVTAGARRYMLQRLNSRVFTRPELVAENIAAVTAHLERAGQRTLTLVAARDGAPLVRDAHGAPWRMSAFIEGALTLETARDATDAERAAEAFGRFQRALATYAGPPLHVTLPGFHDTAAHVAALDRAIAADPQARAASARDAITGLEPYRAALSTFFHRARTSGPRLERIAHHDAKIANVLFDETSGAAICVVDLDTVMPGLSLYDFGDLIRSMVSEAAEDERDIARIAADPRRYEAIVRGYLRGAAALIARDERALLPGAAEAMVFEQSVRFLTDHLEGDRYYRVARPEHNLVRARAQLALLTSLAAQREQFVRMVTG